MEGNIKVQTDLLQSCISQFEDIHNGNQTSIRFNNRKVEIVSIYSHDEFQTPTTIKRLTVHFFQRIMDTRRRGSRIGMRCHNSHDTTPPRIQTSRNNPKHHILTRENPSNLRTCRRHSRALRSLFHNTHSSRPMLLHQLGHLSNCSFRTNSSWLRA